MIENWKSVPGFDAYEVSDMGNVRSVDRFVTYSDGRVGKMMGKALKNCRRKDGYVAVNLMNGGKAHSKLVHELVLLAFVGPRPSGDTHVCHRDGTRDNNILSNIRYGTRSENEKDKVLHGTSNRGERCGTSKLTVAEVVEIRAMLREDGFLQKDIAVRYGISEACVSKIKHGGSWIDRKAT